jgi:UDP-perosamine 4-acetyltransferase
VKAPGKVVVIGGGGHAKVVIDLLRAAGWEVVGYTDPAAAPGATLVGVPCLGSDGALAGVRAAGVAHALVALGDNGRRERAAREAVAQGFALANAIHPSSQLSPSVRLGQGLALMAGTVVNADTALGDNAILNTAATVDHDCAIGAAVHIAPGVHVAGSVRVGDGALVGVGAVVGRGRPLAIGRGAVIGAGAVVLVDVPPFTTVVGNPARPLGPAGEGARESR